MVRSKLIILRGPSGSGKSTTAKKLFESATRRTVLLEQDHYRFIFKPAGGGSKPNSDTIHKMIRSNTLTALEDGYDVILEGILKRHETRREKFSGFGEKEMREWYPTSHRSNHELETIIPETYTLTETLKFIKEICSL